MYQLKSTIIPLKFSKPLPFLPHFSLSLCNLIKLFFFSIFKNIYSLSLSLSLSLKNKNKNKTTYTLSHFQSTENHIYRQPLHLEKVLTTTPPRGFCNQIAMDRLFFSHPPHLNFKIHQKKKKVIRSGEDILISHLWFFFIALYPFLDFFTKVHPFLLFVAFKIIIIIIVWYPFSSSNDLPKGTQFLHF